MSPPTLFSGETCSAARISDDGLYRYSLLRQWGSGPSATFIMLNPSTADAEQDDPTIRRCVGFARTWGMTAVRVVNLYALRSPNPAALWAADDPIGPENDDCLIKYAESARLNQEPLVAAWGALAKSDRVEAVLNLPGMARLTALAITKGGQPRHPLYLRSDAIPQPWMQP